MTLDKSVNIINREIPLDEVLVQLAEEAAERITTAREAEVAWNRRDTDAGD